MLDKSAATVAQTIFDHFIYLHGFPRAILTDNGLEFKNEVLTKLNEICNVEHRFSAAYRPQTIGSLERNHRVLNEFFRNYLNTVDWPSLVKYYVFVWNTTPSANLNNYYSPYYLVYGFEPNMPDFLGTSHIPIIYNVDDRAKRITHNLAVAQANMRAFLNKIKEKQRIKSKQDERTNDLKIGDIIKLTNEARQKFDSFYIGPFTIVGIKKKNYILAKQNDPKQYIVHKDRVSKFTNDSTYRTMIIYERTNYACEEPD